ncbi:MAG: hypothetical protein FJW20_03480 [Acidimicrobiia bacterium]|nr:hypothetical protein [Acidimicrobiia bacterium]
MEITAVRGGMGVLEGREAGGGGVSDSPQRLAESASQFEALMVAQMLRHIRESGSGWMAGEEKEAGSRMMELAEEQLAQALAAGGGLGMATMVRESLTKDGQSKGGGPRPMLPGA